MALEEIVLSSQIKTLEEFIEIRRLLEASQMIQAAMSSGVLSALSAGQKTAAEISQHVGLDVSAVTLLVESLIHVGVLEKYDLYYALSAAAQMLPTDGPNKCWSHLDEYLRTGESLARRADLPDTCLLYTSPSPRDRQKSRMPSSA